jgi:hypothetical protein
MNWYQMVKAAPLPRAEYPETKKDYHSLHNLVDMRETRDSLDRLMPEGYEDPMGELDFLGAGKFGMVYVPKSDPTKVVKFTKNSNDYEVAKTMLEWQQVNKGFHPNVVGVYEAAEVPGSKGVYRIVTERVTPHKAQMKNTKDLQNNQKQIDQGELSDKLKDHGFNPWDLHEGNYGRRPSSGEDVAFDLGGLR